MLSCAENMKFYAIKSYLLVQISSEQIFGTLRLISAELVALTVMLRHDSLARADGHRIVGQRGDWLHVSLDTRPSGLLEMTEKSQTNGNEATMEWKEQLDTRLMNEIRDKWKSH